MKVRLFDRILIAIGSCLLLLVSVFSLILFSGLLKFDGSIGLFVEGLSIGLRIGFIVLGLLVGAIGLYGLITSLLHRKERKYVCQENENGNVSISIKALEIMAKKCIDSNKDMKPKHIDVYRKGDGVGIDVSILVPTGVSIPQLVGNLKMQVRKYVSSCSGIPVETIDVQVETDPSQKGYVPALMPPQDEPAKDEPIVIEGESVQAVPNEEITPKFFDDEFAVSDDSSNDSSNDSSDVSSDASSDGSSIDASAEADSSLQPDMEAISSEEESSDDGNVH